MEINRCGVWKLIVVDGVESKSIVAECGNQSLWSVEINRCGQGRVEINRCGVWKSIVVDGVV